MTQAMDPDDLPPSIRPLVCGKGGKFELLGQSLSLSHPVRLKIGFFTTIKALSPAMIAALGTSLGLRGCWASFDQLPPVVCAARG